MTTIVLLVSRPDYLDLVFASLELMNCNATKTNLLTIVDGDNRLFVDARNRTELSKFENRLCIPYDSKDKMKNNDLNHRRKRIADIHNFAKQYIRKSDYIFCVEDDTTFGIDTLTRLMDNYRIVPFAGMIQGTQIGRHGIPHYGAWRVDEIYNPTEIKSMMPPDTNKKWDTSWVQKITECDAGGLFCMLTKAEAYMAHTFKPFDTGDLGPDFDYGLELRKQGYKNYTDWSITCHHHTKRGVISPSTTTTQTVLFKKVEQRWRQKSL